MKARDLGKRQTLLDGVDQTVSATDNRGRFGRPRLGRCTPSAARRALKLGDKSSNPEGCTTPRRAPDARRRRRAPAAEGRGRGVRHPRRRRHRRPPHARARLTTWPARRCCWWRAPTRTCARSRTTRSTARTSGARRSTARCKAIGVLDDLSPLHMALDCEEPSAAMIDLLLEHRADPNVRDAETCTPLHIALPRQTSCRNGVDDS